MRWERRWDPPKGTFAWAAAWALLCTTWVGMMLAGHFCLEAIASGRRFGPVTLTALGSHLRALLALPHFTSAVGVAAISGWALVSYRWRNPDRNKGPASFLCFGMCAMLCLAFWAIAAVFVTFQAAAVRTM